MTPVSVPHPRLDDRGRPVRLFSPRTTDAEDEFAADLARRVEFLRHTQGFWVAVLAALAMILAGIAIASGLPPLAALIFAAGVPIAAAILLMVYHGKRLARLLRLTLVSAGRCAQCAYSLADLEPESDGCCVCPECGAAWRLDPATRDRLRAVRAFSSSPPEDPNLTAADRRDRRMLRWFIEGIGGKRHFAVVDDRGRVVDLVHPSVHRRPPPGWDALPPDLRRRLTSRLRLLGWPKRVLAAVTIGPFLVYLWIIGAPGVGAGGPTRVGFVLVYALAFPLMLALYVVRPQPGNGRPIRRLFLRERLCPTCAGNLEPVEPGPDGCRVCPICLSAWRLQRAG